MPKKISDDFTQTLKYRNDLSKIKKKGTDDLRMMDYIFILEKQNQELFRRLEEMEDTISKLNKLP